MEDAEKVGVGCYCLMGRIHLPFAYSTGSPTFDPEFVTDENFDLRKALAHCAKLSVFLSLSILVRLGVPEANKVMIERMRHTLRNASWVSVSMACGSSELARRCRTSPRSARR